MLQRGGKFSTDLAYDICRNVEFITVRDNEIREQCYSTGVATHKTVHMWYRGVWYEPRTLPANEKVSCLFPRHERTDSRTVTCEPCNSSLSNSQRHDDLSLPDGSSGGLPIYKVYWQGQEVDSGGISIVVNVERSSLLWPSEASLRRPLSSATSLCGRTFGSHRIFGSHPGRCRGSSGRGYRTCCFD